MWRQTAPGSSVNQVDELRLLQQCLKAIVRPGDPVALLAVLRGELFGISDTEKLGVANGVYQVLVRLPSACADRCR